MRIGVFCSGGDAPGMNACVRAVIRSAMAAGHEVIGIRRGYQGLLAGDFHWDDDATRCFTLRAVSGVLQSGGTLLQSSRSEEFRTEEGQRKAAEMLTKQGIDALVPIGGDGTFCGAIDLARHWSGAIIGCPGTIDNDLAGTDYTIGFHTAVKTAVDAVDKLRDTAESHERLFLVEVMGRACGYIALYTALAGGAEIACIPETTTDVPEIVEQVRQLKDSGKTSVMAVVAEGDESGGAYEIAQQLEDEGCPFPVRVVVLGHLQRGGTPVPADRILASRLGDFAVRGLLEGQTLMMAGEVRGQLTLTPFAEACSGHKTVPQELVELLKTLATVGPACRAGPPPSGPSRSASGTC